MLPCDLVWSVCLGLCTRSKSYAWDAVATLDGYTVGGEGPLVAKWAALSLFLCNVIGPKPCIAPKCMVCIHKRLDVWCALLVDPCWEEALRLIDVACPCRSVVHVHGDLDVLCVLLAGRKVLDLLEAALVCLAGGHSAVDGD